VEDSVIVTPEVVGRIDAIQAATGASHMPADSRTERSPKIDFLADPERIARLDLNVLDD
jgi:hypothetical protein